MKAIGEGRNSAVGLSPWDGGVGLLPRGLGGRCGLGYQLVFLPFWVIFLLALSAHTPCSNDVPLFFYASSLFVIIQDSLVPL
jgi:hypothetical protein